MAEILYLNALRLQIKEFKKVTPLQPLKYMLLFTVILLMIGAAPLMFVYLDIVWFHYDSVLIVYVSVLMNAMSKTMTGILINAIYYFREKIT